MIHTDRMSTSSKRSRYRIYGRAKRNSLEDGGEKMMSAFHGTLILFYRRLKYYYNTSSPLFIIIAKTVRGKIEINK